MKYIKTYEKLTDKEQHAKNFFNNYSDTIDSLITIIGRTKFYLKEISDLLNEYESQKYMLDKFPELAKNLMESDIIIHPKTKEEFSHLFDSIELGLLEKQIEMFDDKTKNETYSKLKKDDDVYEDFNNLFLLAIKEGELDMVKTFIDKGANIDYDEVLTNSLNWDEIFEYLINLGADPEYLSVTYYTKTNLENENIIKILLNNDHYDWVKKHKLYIPDNIKEDPEYEYLFDSDELGLL